MLGVTEAGALPKSRQQRVHLELHIHVSATPCNGNTTLLPLFACQGNPSGLVLGQGSSKPGKPGLVSPGLDTQEKNQKDTSVKL